MNGRGKIKYYCEIMVSKKAIKAVRWVPLSW